MFQPRRVSWCLVLGVVLAGCAPAPRAQPQAARTASPSEPPSSEPKIIRFEASYLVRGRTEPVTVRVQNLDPITAVEITPPDDVSVRAMTLIESGPRESSWSLVFSVEPGAQPVKRSVVLVSPSARSQPHTIDIATHVPEIRELKIVSVRTHPVELEFTVTVFDVEDDLGTTPSVASMLSCPPRFLEPIAWFPWKVEKKSPQETVLYFKSSRVSAISIRGTCRLVVVVADEKKYSSRAATVDVEFK